MPNSLIPDFPIVTAEMPRSSLSKADIAAPKRDMTEALGQTLVAALQPQPPPMSYNRVEAGGA